LNNLHDFFFLETNAIRSLVFAIALFWITVISIIGFIVFHFIAKYW